MPLARAHLLNALLQQLTAGPPQVRQSCGTSGRREEKRDRRPVDSSALPDSDVDVGRAEFEPFNHCLGSETMIAGEVAQRVGNVGGDVVVRDA